MRPGWSGIMSSTKISERFITLLARLRVRQFGEAGNTCRRWWRTIRTESWRCGTSSISSEQFPSARPPVPDMIAALAPLQPRLYSISSSLKANPDEVHLTVGVVRYMRSGRERKEWPRPS